MRCLASAELGDYGKRFFSFLNATIPEPSGGRKHQLSNAGVGAYTSTAYEACLNMLIPGNGSIYILEFAGAHIPAQQVPGCASRRRWPAAVDERRCRCAVNDGKPGEVNALNPGGELCHSVLGARHTVCGLGWLAPSLSNGTALLCARRPATDTRPPCVRTHHSPGVEYGA